MTDKEHADLIKNLVAQLDQAIENAIRAGLEVRFDEQTSHSIGQPAMINISVTLKRTIE